MRISLKLPSPTLIQPRVHAWILTPFIALLGTLAFTATPALAETAGPQWTVTAVSRPTDFTPADASGEDSYKVSVTNTGGAASAGPLQIIDELPTGLTLDPAGAFGENPLASTNGGKAGVGFSCLLDSCTYTGSVVPDQTLVLSFPVDVGAAPFVDTCEVPAAAAGCVSNVIRVSGGGAQTASASTPTVISPAKAAFGIAKGSTSTALSTLQAGAHADITSTIAFDTVNAGGSTAGDFKNVVYRLPPGFASDFADTPACSPAVLLLNLCPIPTQVGVTTITLDKEGTPFRYIEPVYNVTPSAGEIATFAFTVVATSTSRAPSP